MILYDIIWYYMIVYDIILYYMIVYDIIWYYVILCDIIIICTIYVSTACLCTPSVHSALASSRMDQAKGIIPCKWKWSCWRFLSNPWETYVNVPFTPFLGLGNMKESAAILPKKQSTIYFTHGNCVVLWATPTSKAVCLKVKSRTASLVFTLGRTLVAAFVRLYNSWHGNSSQ